MKLETALSEDRIRKFEANLKLSKDHLDSALLEKETLQRKIEAVETQIINANKLREDMQEKLTHFETQIDEYHCKRREFSESEKDVGDDIDRLERQLKVAKDHLSENTVRCEEAEKRLFTLDSDCQNAMEKHEECSKRSAMLEKEIDQKLLKLKAYEHFERKYADEDCRRAHNMKLLDSYYREAEGRVETGKLNITRLQRVVERTEDEIESLQLRSRAAQVELQNVVQTLVND